MHLIGVETELGQLAEKTVHYNLEEFRELFELIAVHFQSSFDGQMPLPFSWSRLEIENPVEILWREFSQLQDRGARSTRFSGVIDFDDGVFAGNSNKGSGKNLAQ